MIILVSIVANFKYQNNLTAMLNMRIAISKIYSLQRTGLAYPARNCQTNFSANKLLSVVKNFIRGNAVDGDE